jgi:hypothetical protein
MAGIENIVVHSKVGTAVAFAMRLVLRQLLILLPTVLPRSLDPGPRAALNLVERPAAQEEHRLRYFQAPRQ